MPYNIWCDGCKNHIGMGKFVEKISTRSVISVCFLCFMKLLFLLLLFVQGSVTMQRRRKWGTITPQQSTGKVGLRHGVQHCLGGKKKCKCSRDIKSVKM